MSGVVSARLAELGIEIPDPVRPKANYVGWVTAGDLVFVSGHICLDAAGRVAPAGKLGSDVGVKEGQAGARLCAVNVLATLQAAVGSLDKVVGVVRLGGFVNVAEGFSQVSEVMNGASDLMVAVFGEVGRHSRTTVGVAALPGNAAVEVEAVFRVL